MVVLGWPRFFLGRRKEPNPKKPEPEREPDDDDLPERDNDRLKEPRPSLLVLPLFFLSFFFLFAKTGIGRDDFRPCKPPFLLRVLLGVASAADFLYDNLWRWTLLRFLPRARVRFDAGLCWLSLVSADTF